VFATLLGAYPVPPDPGPPNAVVHEVVAELAAAGLEPVSDGRGAREAREPGDVTAIVDAWRFAASSTERAVKQALVGPYTLARRPAQGGGAVPVAVPAAKAEALHATISALAAAGCPMVEIEEPAAAGIGGDDGERQRFAEGLRTATAGLGDRVHLSLIMTGGNVDGLGAATIYDLPFSSYAFDLIAGPDNWRLIAQAPPDRGIVLGALDPSPSAGDRPEVLVWAAHYAASIGGRGLVRVGLANASGIEGLTWERARAKIQALGDAARLAGTNSPEELAGALDPRAVDIRSAALGRYDPDAPRPRKPPRRR
jgi:methionine synthase II (cobalamin-independent)